MFDIVSILKENRVSFKEVSGTDEKVMQCPVCGKEDHFYFNSRKNLGICQKCKWECNAVIFLMALLDINLPAALSIWKGRRDTSLDGLRGRVRGALDELIVYNDNELVFTEVFFKNPFPKGVERVTSKKFPAEFKRRKIPFKLIEDLNLNVGFCNSRGRFYNRIIFPIKTLRTETFSAVTALDKEMFKKIRLRYKSVGIKYSKSVFPKGSFMNQVIFLYDNFRFSKKPLFVVEGIWDALKLIKYGFNAVPVMSNLVSRYQTFLLSKTQASKLFLMLDGSVEKELVKKIYYRLFNTCFDKEIRVCTLPYNKDPDDATKKEVFESILRSKSVLL